VQDAELVQSLKVQWEERSDEGRDEFLYWLLEKCWPSMASQRQ
jgi:hypothetical protein